MVGAIFFVYFRRMIVNPYFTIYENQRFKFKTEKLKFLEDKTGKIFEAIGVAKIFLNRTSIALGTQR